MTFGDMTSFIFNFLFYYPLVMAYTWTIGALIYYYKWERHDPDEPPMPDNPAPVSILVPCHNEGDNAYETIDFLLKQQYPEFEVIAINDASTDNTGEILDEIASKHNVVRVIHLEKNMGKAMGLNMAAIAAKHDFLICIDGDALLDEKAISWIMRHFKDAKVGAVTGNPRIRTRSTLLGKIQVGEFSAIVGAIKRAQRVYGKVFTVSGVIVGFRKAAVHQVGYWSTNMITDDIDISWKLHTNGWHIRFEPKALCWILMPETYKGLIRQRARWAQGGVEVLIYYFKSMLTLKNRHMWPIYLEFVLSVFWSYCMIATFILWGIGTIFPLPEALHIRSLLPGWGGVLLGLTCLLQFAVSLAIESQYEKHIWRIYYWMVWFPLAYWLINVIAVVIGFPKAVFRNKEAKATWVTTDRGMRE